MIQFRYSGNAHKGTLAEFTASTRKWDLGDMLMPTDSAEIRIGTGTDVFTDLMSLPVATAAKITAIGAPTAFTVVGATFADLAAARTAVNQLSTDAMAGLTATNAKVDALIASLKTGGLMVS